MECYREGEVEVKDVVVATGKDGDVVIVKEELNKVCVVSADALLKKLEYLLQ